jgi:hypothetical protein
VIPSSLQAFAVDTEFAGFVLSKQVQGDSVEQGEVLCGIGGPFSAGVFSEADIRYPVQFVLDAPVLANFAVQLLGSGFETGDVGTDLLLDFARSLVIPCRQPASGTSP